MVRIGSWNDKPVALRMSSSSSTGYENVIMQGARRQEAQPSVCRQVQAGRREVSAPPARLEQRDSRGGGRQAGLLPRVRVGAAAACSSPTSPPPRGALLRARTHPGCAQSSLPWAVGGGGRARGQGGAQAGQAGAEAAAHARAGAASTVSSHGSRSAVCAGSPSPHGLPPPPLGASHRCGPCGCAQARPVPALVGPGHLRPLQLVVGRPALRYTRRYTRRYTSKIHRRNVIMLYL